jgi:hypothetical protein
MKLFDKMKTNEREMILSMLANNAERNIGLLVEQTFDDGCPFTSADVLKLAHYLSSLWGVDLTSIYMLTFDEQLELSNE